MKNKVDHLYPLLFKKSYLKNVRFTLLKFLLLLVPITTHGESLIEQIGWEGAPTRIIIAVLLVLLSLVTIMVVLYARMRNKIRKDQSEVSSRLFNELCTKSELYPSEVKKLQQLLTHEVIPYPHTIFQSAALFERCVDAEIRLLLLGANETEDIDDDEKLIATIRKKLGYSYLPLEHPLLSTRNLEIGQSVSVFTLTGSAPLIQHAIIVSNRETSFRLEYDNERDGPIHLLPGQEIKIAFARQGDGVYGVKVEITSAAEATIECLHTLHFRRNQMRQYARIEVNLPIRIRMVPVTKPGVNEVFPQHVDAKLCDISGGGLSFLYEKPFVPGDAIVMHFSLSTGKFTSVPGKILRVNLQEGKTTTRYRHHVQFTNIEQPHRDRIIKYIFEKQRQINQMR
jgi:c-di-GMP-binding flagellar brake protein YcgR